MLRVAWFTPLAPVQSGISAYSADILPLVAQSFEIDAFDEPCGHQFVARHFIRPYDLVVYQLGNASCHDYMWAYLFRYPGLVVLHDTQLHQARALALLKRQRRAEHYRAEFMYNHPDARPEIADFLIEGRGGVLYHLWPMQRGVVSAARMIAVHNRHIARELQASYPAARVECIRMGVPDGGASGQGIVRRRRHSIPDRAVVFVAFGGVTPEKRMTTILRAFRSIVREHPTAHLLVIGATAAHYDVVAEARELDLGEHVTLTGFVPDADLPAWIDAADICLCLRWPSSGETSASWLRCLAAGKATVITDLVHQADVPSLDPRSWVVAGGQTAVGGRAPAMCVSIDILDEEHSLKLAMRRLAGDVLLREQLGGEAHAFWAREHTLEAMANDYRGVITRAAAVRAPTVPNLPDHLRDDGSALTRSITSGLGVSVDMLQNGLRHD